MCSNMGTLLSGHRTNGRRPVVAQGVPGGGVVGLEKKEGGDGSSVIGWNADVNISANSTAWSFCSDLLSDG